MKKLVDEIGEASLLELLAEECSELAHASLKTARILRGENPTDKIISVAQGEVLEEIADVRLTLAECQCMSFYSDAIVDHWIKEKGKRMAARIDGTKKPAPANYISELQTLMDEIKEFAKNLGKGIWDDRK